MKQLREVKNLKTSSKVQRQPAEGGRDRGHVLQLQGEQQHSEATGGLADSKAKCVTLIQPRCDEAVENCLKVPMCKNRLHLCQLPSMKKAGLNHCTNCYIRFYSPGTVQLHLF